MSVDELSQVLAELDALYTRLEGLFAALAACQTDEERERFNHDLNAANVRIEDLNRKLELLEPEQP